MALKWDVIYWDGELTTDFVPSIWANSSKTEYKLPVGPRMTESKKRALIYTCASLEEGNYTWYKATCKKREVTSLEKAKTYCRKLTVTSNLESEDDTISSTDDENCISEHLKLKKSVAKQTAGDMFSVPILDMPVSLVDANPTVQGGFLTLTDIPYANSPISEISGASLPSNASSLEAKLDIILQRCNELKFSSARLENIEKRMERIETTLHYVMERDLLVDSSTELLQSQKKAVDLLPLNSVESLQDCETQLTNESFKHSLEEVLFLVGGDTFHKAIYNIMKKLLSPELTVLYSGQGRKKKLPFCTLTIYGVITAAVRRRFPDVADVSIRKSVSAFLASAKDRLPKSV